MKERKISRIARITKELVKNKTYTGIDRATVLSGLFIRCAQTAVDEYMIFDEDDTQEFYVALELFGELHRSILPDARTILLRAIDVLAKLPCSPVDREMRDVFSMEVQWDASIASRLMNLEETRIWDKLISDPKRYLARSEYLWRSKEALEEIRLKVTDRLLRKLVGGSTVHRESTAPRALGRRCRNVPLAELDFEIPKVAGPSQARQLIFPTKLAYDFFCNNGKHARLHSYTLGQIYQSFNYDR